MKNQHLAWTAAFVAAMFLCLGAGRFYPPLNSYLTAKFYWHFAYCTPYFDENYLYRPAEGSLRARILIIPGNNLSAREFITLPAGQAWLRGLAAMHDDAVIFNGALAQPCWFVKDGGKEYRAKFARELDDIMQDVAQRHGVARQVLISGFSLGGLHAMMGYALHPERFAGWQADISVTKVAALGEYAAVGTVPYFNPFYELKALKASHGFLTWGSTDMRVDHRLTQALYDLIKSPGVQGLPYPGEGHVWNEHHAAKLLADTKRQIGP